MMPKKGDIIWIEGWGGVIGEFVDYDEKSQTLILQYVGNLPWKYDVGCARPFLPVKPDQISILSPKEVLEKMAEKISDAIVGLDIDLTRATSSAIKRMSF